MLPQFSSDRAASTHHCKVSTHLNVWNDFLKAFVHALLIDDHGSHVTDMTWELYGRFIERAGPRPTLIEWDTDVPAFGELMAEADMAAAIMDELCHAAAI